MARGFCGLLLAAALLPASARAAAPPPGELLIYYGWPSAINGSPDLAAAAAEFGRYDRIVLGDGLEDPVHLDHDNTVAILADPALAGTRVHGYIDLGVLPGQNLPLQEIERRVAAWQATGADGVLFDEFGYDYAVSRERQNAAVAAAHARGLSVIANAWVPSDALDPSAHPIWNPDGLAPLLSTGDFYLYESFQVQEGSFVPAQDWQAKAEALETYRPSLGIGVLAVTTSLPGDPYDEMKFLYAWHSALLYGYDAFGWGEWIFGAGDSMAPYRTRPEGPFGSAFLSDRFARGSSLLRYTDAGLAHVDMESHEAGFDPGLIEVDSPAGARRLRAYPNPFTDRVSLVVDAPPTGTLQIFDAEGRRVAVLSGNAVEWQPARVAGSIFFVRAGDGAVRKIARAR